MLAASATMRYEPYLTRALVFERIAIVSIAAVCCFSWLITSVSAVPDCLPRVSLMVMTAANSIPKFSGVALTGRGTLGLGSGLGLSLGISCSGSGDPVTKQHPGTESEHRTSKYK